MFLVKKNPNPSYKKDVPLYKTVKTVPKYTYKWI